MGNLLLMNHFNESSKAWFPYDPPHRPDRPSRLKKCSDDRISYGNATQMIANDPDDWDDLKSLDRIEFYPDDRVNFKAII